MGFKLAKFLLAQENQCNGHLQNTMSNLSVKQGLKICKDLEKATNYEYSFVLQLWTNKSFSIYQIDYWNMGEHPLYHTDRMILSADSE